MTNFAKDFSLRAGKILLIAATIILALSVLLTFLRFGFVYWIYSTVEGWAVTRLGFDYYPAQLFSTIITSIFTLLSPSLAWYMLLGKKKAWGVGTMIGTQAAIGLLVYTLGSGVCFDRQTGEPLCYFVDTPSGRQWSQTPGFDPVSGKAFRLYTREIKDAEDRSKRLENQSGSETNRSGIETVTQYSVPIVKNQTVPQTPRPRKQSQDRERAATVDNSSKKQDKKTFQSGTTEIEVPVTEEQKVGTYSTIQPRRVIDPNPDSNGGMITVQPQPVPPRTTHGEISNTESRRQNTTPNPKNPEKKKEDPVNKALKNSAIDLLNFGLGKLKRKIQ